MEKIPHVIFQNSVIHNFMSLGAGQFKNGLNGIMLNGKFNICFYLFIPQSNKFEIPTITK